MNDKNQRSIDKLYTPQSTYRCAIHGPFHLRQANAPKDGVDDFGESDTKRGRQQQHNPTPCVPCAYKIAAFDVALDTYFTRL